MRASLPCLLLALTLTFGCSEQSLTETDSPADVRLEANSSETTDFLAASKKGNLVEICHVPNGHEGGQSMFVSGNAAASHLANHTNDFEGNCDLPEVNFPPVISEMSPSDYSFFNTLGDNSIDLEMFATVVDPEGDALSVQICTSTTTPPSPNTCIAMNSDINDTWETVLNVQNDVLYWQVVASDGVNPAVSSPWFSIFVNFEE